MFLVFSGEGSFVKQVAMGFPWLKRISHGILPFFHWILPFYPWGYFGLKFGLSFSFGSWKLMILLRLKMPSSNNFYPSSLLSFVSFKENHIIQNLILATMHRMLYAQRIYTGMCAI